MDLWSIAVMLAAAVVALEIVAVFRRGIGGLRGYLVLLGIDAALLGYTIAEPRFADDAGPWPELVGGVVLCVMIVFVPRLLGRLIRRAVGAERMATAARLAAIKEVLQPGLLATAEREVLADLAQVQGGAIDGVVRRLRERVREAESDEAEVLGERLITVLGFGRRYREAVAHFEARYRSFEPGRHPGIAIQMVRAYGELGDLEQAAAIVQRVEHSARAGQLGALAALGQVRLLFLAFVGGQPVVARLLEAPGAAAIPPRLRASLLEIAAPRPEATVVGEEVERFAAAVAERVAADLRSAVDVAPEARTDGTLGLIAVNLVAFVIFALTSRFTIGDLVRAGGSLHPAVRVGEWWRLWTAMFLHAGGTLGEAVIHLGLNMYGLYLLGRLIEPLFGTRRFLVIYGVAGVAGNLLSIYNPRETAVLSVGASGAVMGLLGALLVSLLPRRSQWPEGMRRGLLPILFVLVGLQLALGASKSVVDNFAHVGGLLGGCAAAGLLLPGGLLGPGRLASLVVGGLLGLFLASTAWSGIELGRTRLDETMRRLPRRDERVGGLVLEVASHTLREVPERPEWPGEVLLVEPVTDLLIVPHILEAAPGREAKEVIASCMERDRRAIVTTAHERREVAPPVEEVQALLVPGWEGAALAQGGASPSRMLYFGRLDGPGRVAIVEVTTTGARPLSQAAIHEIERILASVRTEAAPSLGPAPPLPRPAEPSPIDGGLDGGSPLAR